MIQFFLLLLDIFLTLWLRINTSKPGEPGRPCCPFKSFTTYSGRKT